MKDDIDIEEQLNRFRTDPGSHVKRSVLSRFAQTCGSRTSVAFWRRPIPLHVALAAVVIMVALSFITGQQMSRSGRRLATPLESHSETTTAVIEGLDWEIAPADLL